MARLAAALCAILLLVGTGPGAASTPASATDFISGLADTSVGNLTEPGLSKHERARRFRELLEESFAVHGIARFVLGRYWRRATQEQRQEFVQLLLDTVTRTWANRLSEFSRGGLTIIGETPAASSRPDETDAIVRTSYGTPDGSLAISWRVANKGRVYKITDIQIEGVSMVTTYRDEITSTIRRSGGAVEGLLEEMRRNLADSTASTL